VIPLATLGGIAVVTHMSKQSEKTITKEYTRPYYTLAVRANGKWGPEFGDFDKETVKDEMEDCENEWCEMKIIKSGVDQAAIDAEIKKLNA
jgi:hypothetical protein